jgi:hypothetical protein
VRRSDDGNTFDVDFSGVDLPGLTDRQQKLLIELEKTRTVMRVVFKANDPSCLRRFLQRIQPKLCQSPGEAESERNRYRYYLEKLAELARAGLQSDSKVDYALLALQALRDEFVSYEAERVKNRYVETLGSYALLYGIPLFVLYWIIRYSIHAPSTGESVSTLRSVIFRNREFLLLAAGACVGTWLSFSIRRVVLGFSDLATLEDDRLRPTARIFFVIGLTLVIGMLLQSHWVGFAIGGTVVSLNSSGLLALLIGILCGISERAMATAVSRRADEFGQRIGGTIPSAASPAGPPPPAGPAGAQQSVGARG